MLSFSMACSVCITGAAEQSLVFSGMHAHTHTHTHTCMHIQSVSVLLVIIQTDEAKDVELHPARYSF